DTVPFRIPAEIGSPGVSWQVVVNTGMPSALALPPGNGGPGVVTARVTTGATVAGTAGPGGGGGPPGARAEGGAGGGGGGRGGEPRSWRCGDGVLHRGRLARDGRSSRHEAVAER